MRANLLRLCLSALAVAISPANSARAADIAWASPADGGFLTPSSWAGGVVPGANDFAVFDASGAYTVFLSSDTLISGLRVDESSPTLDLSGGTLTLQLPGSTPASLTMGVTPGALAETIITGGRLVAEELRVAQTPGSIASLRVAGPGAEIDGGFLTHVGSEGLGVLDISGGATVSGTVFFVAAEPGASGFVSVEGAGSRFEPSLVRVGRRGTGTLTVSGGAALAGGPVIVGSSGGDGTFTLSGAGTALDLDNDDLIVGTGTGSLGNASIEAQIWQGRSVVVGENGGDGFFEMPGGGAFLTDDLLVGSSGTGEASIASSAVVLCDDVRIATGSNADGTLNLAGRIQASGNVTVGSGFFSIGRLTLEPGADLTAPTVSVETSGSLRGAGLVSGSLQSSGVVEPRGVLTVDGGFQQFTATGSGLLRVELAGAPRRLETTGDALLAGRLQVQLEPGFSPSSGATFTLLSAASITGSFTQITTPSEAWEVEVTSTEVIATFTGSGPADLDGDGSVDASDLAILIGAWGQSGSAADIDGDGVVGASDLAQLIGAWG